MTARSPLYPRRKAPTMATRACSTALDDGHRDAEDGEHAGVLAADDAPADDEHRPGQEPELEDRVGVPDAGVVERVDRRPDRRRADGDQDHLAPEPGLAPVLRPDG